jgi:hypothetical protein
MIRLTDILTESKIVVEASKTLLKPTKIEFRKFGDETLTPTPPKDINDLSSVIIRFSTSDDMELFYKQMPSSLGGQRALSGKEYVITWGFRTIWIPGQGFHPNKLPPSAVTRRKKLMGWLKDKKLV